MMTQPIELIKERLSEVTIELKNALNNELPYQEIKKLTEIYNNYYVAFQILQSHTNIKFKFSRLYVSKDKKISYGEVFSVHRKKKNELKTA